MIARWLALSLGLLALAACSLPPFETLPGQVSGPQQDTMRVSGNLDPQRPFPGLLGRGMLSPAALKIGLSVGKAELVFQVAVPVALQGKATLQPGRNYRITRSGNDLTLWDATIQLHKQLSPLTMTSTDPGAFILNGRRYRGEFQAIAAPNAPDTATLINVLQTEEYLYGVVPVEMAPGWPTAALQAQAVAARTYALANVGRRADLGFDLYDTTADQVYKGMSVEKPDTTSAVDATAHQLLTWQDKPIVAFFHASSGGETDDALAVWGMDLPYIRGTKDLDPSPHANWDLTLSPGDVERFSKAAGAAVGPIKVFEITTRTPHGRAKLISVQDSSANGQFDAAKFRLAAGLKSTRFTVSRTDAGWRFQGGGWGHGLGLSQWGARAYAELGEGYRPILARYYDNTTLTQP